MYGIPKQTIGHDRLWYPSCWSGQMKPLTHFRLRVKNRWDLVCSMENMLPHMRVWSLNAWDSLVTSLVLQGLTTPRSRGETLRSEGAALAPKQAPNAQVQPATLLKVMVLRMKIRFLAFLKRLKLKELKMGSHLLGLKQ